MVLHQQGQRVASCHLSGHGGRRGAVLSASGTSQFLRLLFGYFFGQCHHRLDEEEGPTFAHNFV